MIGEDLSLFRCSDCGKSVYGDDIGCRENEVCTDCQDKLEREQEAYWRPLYEGEKLAGLLPRNHYRE